jgi:hypothetical protein
MATYKVEIVQRHGKYHQAFYDANGPKGNPLDSKAAESIDDIVKAVQGEIEKRHLDPDQDTVIFRNIGYSDFSMLTREIKRGTY